MSIEENRAEEIVWKAIRDEMDAVPRLQWQRLRGVMIEGGQNNESTDG